MSEKISVSKEALRQVLNAFQGPSHHVMELWAINTPYIDNPVSILIKEFNEEMKALETPPAQEPVAYMDAHYNCDLYKHKPEQIDVIPLYTRPDNSGLRKAAKLFLTIIEEADEYMRSEGIFDLFYDPDEKKVLENLRTALEGK